MHLTWRTSCRVCGGPLVPAIDLGEQYIQSDFAKPGEEPPIQRQLPLNLLRCDPTAHERACGLLQLSVTVPPAILYRRYWYRSGINRTMTEHLRAIARQGIELVGGKSVLDIGSNDGTLLDAFPASWIRVGIDPSDVAAVPEGAQLVRDAFPSPKLTESNFDLITAIACVYDLEDPVGFMRAIRESLAPNGVFIFEQSYLPRMMSQLAYDTICHEHLEYYSLAVIERVCREAGLRVFAVELNDSNGGSIRCFAARMGTETVWPELPFVGQLRRREFELALDTPFPYGEFTKRMWQHKAKLSTLLMRLKAEDKRIHLYGASTKGNTLLQFCNIDSTIVNMAAERSPHKWGARTVGTNIPIVSEEHSRALKPDVYLVLPWHFRTEFLERERAMLDAGTQFIFPLPEIDVVAKVPV